MDIWESDLRSFVNDSAASRRKKSTTEQYCSQLRKWKEYSEGDTSIRSAKDFLSETFDRSPSTAYLAARSVKAYVKWWASEYEQHDWSGEIPWYVETETRPQRTATREDVAKILATCDTNGIKGLRDAAMLTVFGSTSLRRGELAAMQWSDIDFDAGTLSIPKSKTKKSRSVCLPREAARALRRYLIALDAFMDRNGRDLDYEPFVWVSLSRRGNLQPGSITKMVGTRSVLAGVDVTPQSFRRGFAMHWLRSGGSQAYLEKQAGWRSGSPMVTRYVEAVAEEESIVAARRLFD